MDKNFLLFLLLYEIASRKCSSCLIMRNKIISEYLIIDEYSVDFY